MWMSGGGGSNEMAMIETNVFALIVKQQLEIFWVRPKLHWPRFYLFFVFLLCFLSSCSVVVNHDPAHSGCQSCCCLHIVVYMFTCLDVLICPGHASCPLLLDWTVLSCQWYAIGQFLWPRSVCTPGLKPMFIGGSLNESVLFQEYA